MSFLLCKYLSDLDCLLYKKGRGAARLGERAHLSSSSPGFALGAGRWRRDHRVLCRRVREVSGRGRGWCWGTSEDSVPPRFTLFLFQNLLASPRGATLLPKPDHIFLLALDGTDWRVGQLERLVYRNHKSIGLHLICFKINPKAKRKKKKKRKKSVSAVGRRDCGARGACTEPVGASKYLTPQGLGKADPTSKWSRPTGLDVK